MGKSPNLKHEFCTVDGCGKKHRAAGLCVAHYSLERRQRERIERATVYTKTDKEALWAFVKKELKIQ